MYLQHSRQGNYKLLHCLHSYVSFIIYFTSFHFFTGSIYIFPFLFPPISFFLFFITFVFTFLIFASKYYSYLVFQLFMILLLYCKNDFIFTAPILLHRFLYVILLITAIVLLIKLLSKIDWNCHQKFIILHIYFILWI